MTTSLPHPSSTLVNISDDADLRLIRVLAPSTSDPTSFESACTSAISAGDVGGLLRTVIDNGAIAGLLQSSYSIDEAVSAFSLLTVYLDRLGDASAEKELCEALADAVEKAGDSIEDDGKSEKQSAMVAALFNLRSDGNEKVKLLTKIIELADESALSPGQARGVSALADMLDASTLKSSLALWGDIDNAELRALYAAVSKGMDRVLAKLAKGEAEDKTTAMKIQAAKERKQTYMLLVLGSYKEESQLDGEATSYAREASIYAIRDPINLFSTQRRILSLPAVSALQKSQPALYDLLKIFMEGKLQDYRDFTAMPDKMTVFKSSGLDEGECMKNMCLLSLVSLAGEHEEIPYSAIASTLNVQEDEVEQWVIRAVSSGLMEAKMDQLRKVVLVERCAVRQFGMTEWTALKVRLDKWKSNVKGVLDALEKSGAVAVDGQ
eukprot:CAMPEP_0172315254 /NCGR_PEP_ID=MMETSP1058-20130122/24608_1 /TAXON_ID=83371 /ORGANISM="Detonula confervacea, Strain CCMP 353" /LENGTH=436 /DNA_ID=CAMNT_0013029301 /DNA_START=140 /DNA_END=1450 /DNA_ORIENTATION=-